MPLLDTVILYQLLKRIAQPFTETPAYQAGLIDADGNRLKKAKTKEERAADTPFERMLINLKRLIVNTPGGLGLLGTAAAALYLLRETPGPVQPARYQKYLTELRRQTAEIAPGRYVAVLPEGHVILSEDAPANAVGGGHVTGLGVGAGGEPGVRRFGGARVFTVSPSTYYRHCFGKKKHANYRHALGEDDAQTVSAIQHYASQCPDAPIIIQNASTGGMMFLRRAPSARQFSNHP